MDRERRFQRSLLFSTTSQLSVFQKLSNDNANTLFRRSILRRPLIALSKHRSAALLERNQRNL
jgi:hypothetical protein